MEATRCNEKGSTRLMEIAAPAKRLAGEDGSSGGHEYIVTQVAAGS